MADRETEGKTGRVTSLCPVCYPIHVEKWDGRVKEGEREKQEFRLCTCIQDATCLTAGHSSVSPSGIWQKSLYGFVS